MPEKYVWYEQVGERAAVSIACNIFRYGTKEPVYLGANDPPPTHTHTHTHTHTKLTA